MKTETLALSVLLAGAACVDHPNIGHATGGGSTTGGKGLLAPGQPCSFNQGCASGVCGIDGTGNCCAEACATADPICGATSCDGAGACFYPSDSIGCPASCTGATLSQNSCNGEGACAAVSPAPCPGNFACADAGARCDTACASSADCAAGFVCNSGACVPPIEVGPCTEDDDCDSARCGVRDAGSRHCCSAACAFTDPPCGAADCEADSGACMYPDVHTGCGSAQSCDGGVQTNADHCDGMGSCAPGAVSIDCAPYTCGGNACQRGCDEDGGCAAGGSCDLFHHICCAPGLQAGGSIAVDSITGDDTVACCGTEGNQPCQSVTHAMQVIDLDGFRDVTINATVDDGGGGWPGGPPETYPIVLGRGAELYAPGVSFGVPNNLNVITFTIGRVSSNDTVGYASIVGAPSFYVEDGGDIYSALEDGGDPYAEDVAIDQPTNLTHIHVETGSALYLANAIIVGNSSGLDSVGLDSTGSDIDVAAGGALVLGADKSGANTGTVFVDAASTGIECEGGKEGDVGCTISDVPLNGLSSLVIGQSAITVGISAGDNTSISLKSAPRLGAVDNPSAGAFRDCVDFPTLTFSQGIALSGKASMTFDNGAIQCILNQAFFLEASSQGVPSLNLSNTTIQNAGIGVYASAGTVTISNSSIEYNGGGVEQDTDGTNVATIDLSGGAAGGINVVACSSGIEAAGATGVSVLNTTSQPLNASNVAWDTSGPDVFACDAQLADCACEIASCTDTPGGDGMDAVYESTGTITTTGNQAAGLDCTPPDIGDRCDPVLMDCALPWLICCPITLDAGTCALSCSGPG